MAARDLDKNTDDLGQVVRMTLHDIDDIKHRLSIARHDRERLLSAYNLYRKSFEQSGSTEDRDNMNRAKQSGLAAKLRVEKAEAELLEARA